MEPTDRRPLREPKPSADDVRCSAAETLPSIPSHGSDCRTVANTPPPVSRSCEIAPAGPIASACGIEFERVNTCVNLAQSSCTTTSLISWRNSTFKASRPHFFLAAYWRWSVRRSLGPAEPIHAATPRSDAFEDHRHSWLPSAPLRRRPKTLLTNDTAYVPRPHNAEPTLPPALPS